MPASALLVAIGAPVLEAAGSESVRCGCGSTLSFRSNPLKYGRTESRCLNCDPTWEPVRPTIEVPRYIHPDHREDDGEAPRSAPVAAVGRFRRRTATLTEAELRERARREQMRTKRLRAAMSQVLKATSLRADRGVTAQGLTIRLGLSRPMVDRALQALLLEGALVQRRGTRADFGSRSLQAGRYPVLYWRTKE